MPTVCNDRRVCESIYKCKSLVLDSNILLHFIQSIEKGLAKRLTNDQRYENLKYCLNNFLVRLRLCGNAGLIHTTKEVFYGEMDPKNPVSSLRNEPLFTTLCLNSNDNYQEIAHILESNLTISSSNIPRSEVQRFNRLIGPIEGTFQRPSLRDLSLLMLTMKLSTGAEALLLTDDTVLQRSVDQICRTRLIDVFGKPIDTTRIGCTSSLIFLEELYRCCKVQSKEYADLFDTIYAFVENLDHTSGSTLTIKMYRGLLRKIAGEVWTIPK